MKKSRQICLRMIYRFEKVISHSKRREEIKRFCLLSVIGVKDEKLRIIQSSCIFIHNGMSLIRYRFQAFHVHPRIPNTANLCGKRYTSISKIAGLREGERETTKTTAKGVEK